MTRTKSIKIRLTDDEHQQLKSLAGARGISALLRRRALGPDRRQVQSERLKIVAELARARNLLNQIARNSERHTPPEQIQIVAQLLAVERQLSKFKKP
jgi:Trp operon repressor